MPAAQRLRQHVATWHRVLDNCHLNTESQENLKSHFKQNGTGEFTKY
jgi:hypothetical protein